MIRFFRSFDMFREPQHDYKQIRYHIELIEISIQLIINYL
jgi:hypothetical protein